MSDKPSGNGQATGLQTSPPAAGLPAGAAQRGRLCPREPCAEPCAPRCGFTGPGSWMVCLFRSCPADADGQSRMRNTAPDSWSPDESVHCDLI